MSSAPSSSGPDLSKYIIPEDTSVKNALKRGSCNYVYQGGTWHIEDHCNLGSKCLSPLAGISVAGSASQVALSLPLKGEDTIDFIKSSASSDFPNGGLRVTKGAVEKKVFLPQKAELYTTATSGDDLILKWKAPTDVPNLQTEPRSILILCGDAIP
jgi:hypothetical protein